MSRAGHYLKSGIGFINSLEEGKPHSSITDWIEVLSSDRYDELSLDGVPELVESINIQGAQGTTEAARAIRKKLKYGNVHRQLRSLVLLRALTENAGKGFQLNWANQELLGRLKDMASDAHPAVKKRLIMVFHAWASQYKDEPRMQTAAKLYSQFGGAGPQVRKPTAMATTAPTSLPSATRGSVSARSDPATKSSSAAPSSRTNTFDDDMFSHDWAPSKRGPDTYADLHAAKADAEERKRQRDARIALEQHEGETERRDREAKRRQDMAALEAKRQKEAAEEAERRRQAKDAKENAKKQGSQPKRPPFDYQKEKPQIMIAVASAIQAASNLVTACRHLDRQYENVVTSPKVQEALDRAKAARRVVIRYIQIVQIEEMVGTLLEANERVVEAIQLYDKLSKPVVLDSDSDSEKEDAAKASTKTPRDVDALSKKLEAQRLEEKRTGELERLQQKQKKESARRIQRRQSSRSAKQVGGHPDLDDLDFGSISSNKESAKLGAPMRPDEDRDADRQGALSDFSDYISDYDSSEEEWRASQPRRQSVHQPQKKGRGLLDSDPFGDPFAADDDTPLNERQRMQWTEI